MRTRKTLNRPLLRKLALKLRRLRHEEHYDQSEVLARTSCGTAACIAGHAVLLAGWRPILSSYAEDYDFAVHCQKGRKLGRILSVAAEALGLSYDTALFAPYPEESWPTSFARRWQQTQDSDEGERPSRIAADLLDAIADGKVSI